jgi:hypothetical protein
MRNLQQYPLTPEEVITELKNLKNQEAAKNLNGDITPLVLSYVLGFVRAYPEKFKNFIK